MAIPPRGCEIRPFAGLLAVIAFMLTAAPAASARPRDLKPLTTVEGISEYRLDNGLRVLLFPDQSKQKVTVNVTYRVGSRHEGRGEKGMAHLLEHMVFKGTEKFENIWGALQDHGASFNGTTWVDRTNYYETLPATGENLQFALEMEADRMVNSRIAAEDLATEMTVVRNEFEMGENNPVGKLMERMMSAAYLWHNYGQSTIGNRSDIERVPAENLKRFYKKYYQPDNAMLVVAGKFDVDQTLGWIRQYFGPIPRPERTLESSYTEEPVQDGARFVRLSRVGSVQAAGAVYHVCPGSHEDFPALQVLGDVLTSEPSGHIYKALVPDGLAFGVNGFSFAWAEPGVMILMATSRLDQDVEAAHETMLEVAEGIGSVGITEEEVERAKTKMLKGIKLSLTDSGRIGVELSEWEALGDWRMFFIHRDRLKDVTAADVQRIARKYLVESNRTSGIFIPTDEPMRAEIPGAPDVSALVSGYTGTETIAMGEAFEPTPRNIESRTARTTLPGGMKVAMLAKETRGDAVVLNMRFHFGTEASMVGRTTAIDMIPSMLMRGTARLDYQQLRDEINRLKSQISVSATGEPGMVVGSIVSDRENLPAAIELLGEILQTPAFPANEFELVKEEGLAGLENGLTDPRALMFNRINRAMNPFEPGSIHYVPTMEEDIELVRAVTLDDVRAAYRSLYGASHAEVSVVGDFDEPEVERLLSDTFGSWVSPSAYARVKKPYRPIEPLDDVINTPDKQMAVVAMGTVLPMNDNDADYPALAFANYVLGQSAKSRLLNRLRHEGGLSYGAGSMLQSDSQDNRTGLLGFAICAPQNAAEAQQAMREEIRKWIMEGVTEEELVDGKQGYTLQFENTLTNDQFIAGELASGLEIGRTFTYHENLIRQINRLSGDDIARSLKDRLSSATMVELKAGDLEGESD